MTTQKRSAWQRSVITLSVVVVLLLAFVGIRDLLAMGVFTQIEPQFAGVCRTITGLSGPGDMQLDAADGLVFISAQNRGGAMGAKDGIYTLAVAGEAQPVRAAGTPADFHPGGLSLFRAPDNSLTLMVVNHLSAGPYAVEVFGVTVADGKVTLTPRTTVAGGLLIHPNDVVAAGTEAFYVTNDSTVKNPKYRDWANYLLLRQSNVLYFDGNNLRPVARGLDFANGIQISPHGDYVYVAASWGRTIVSYARQPFTGALTDPQSLSLPTRPDNLDMDAEGNLWVSGQPKFLAARGHAPSQIFRVLVQDGRPNLATPIYVNDGSQISGSSTGVAMGKRLFISAGGDKKILDCTMD